MKPTCPKCQSNDVTFRSKKQCYICEDCNSEFKPEKEFKALRIFISYGHDEHSVFAEKLALDLKERGHLVWFDQERLKPGGDWEQNIEDGIDFVCHGKNDDTGRFLFIMTPHSVRRPDGFCLNELARAISRSLPIIPVMLVHVEAPLSICKLQFLDMKDCFSIKGKSGPYEQRFERLVQALEERNLDFEGFQSLLIKLLTPINFTVDIEGFLNDFTGRKWLIAKIDQWIQDENGSKIFWLTGVPGSGKSAIAAWIRDNRREVAAFHFCDINSEEKRNPSKLVLSIAYQLSTQLPEYELRLKSLDLKQIIQKYHESYTLFDKLVVQPLSENFPPPGRIIMVLIDALDEATYQDRNEIAHFLSISASKTPSWFKFLITSRPEQQLQTALKSLSPCTMDTQRPENKEDIRAYLETKLQTITSTQMEQLLYRSEGVFLFAKKVVEEILQNRLSLERIDEFPQGLGAVYLLFFQRIFNNRLDYYQKQVRPLLAVILASFEPIQLSLLKTLMKKTNRMKLFDILDTLGSLFQMTGYSDTDTISPYHRSLVDWLTDKSLSGFYYVDPEYGHELIKKYGWKQYHKNVDRLPDYYMRFLPMHLEKTGQTEQLILLLKDFTFMMARVRSGHLEQLLMDYRGLVTQLLPHDQHQLVFEQAFFQEKSHILKRGDEDWPAFKILFQLAIEFSQDNPLRIGSMKYLSDGRTNWTYLIQDFGKKTLSVNQCLAVIETTGRKINGLLFDHFSRIVSWNDNEIFFWDLFGNLILKNTLCVSSNKKIIRLLDGTFLSWADDNDLIILNECGIEKFHLNGHTNKITGAIQLQDGRLLSWSEDRTIRIWDKFGILLNVMAGHEGKIIKAIELSENKILSYSEDYKILIWDTDGFSLLKRMGHLAEIKGVLELSTRKILSWSDDKTIRLWNTNGTLRKIMTGHQGYITGALELKSGKVLTWAYDKTIKLWSLSGTLLDTIDLEIVSVEKVIEINQNSVLTWTMAKELLIIDIETHTKKELNNSDRFVEGARILSSGNIVTWLGDHSIRIFDSHGNLLNILTGHTDLIKGVKEYSKETIVSWSLDMTIRIWDLKKENSLISDKHTGRVTGMIKLKDGRILTWGYDEKILIWNPQGELLNKFIGHNWWVEGVMETKDEKLLSWSSDYSIHIWRNNGEPDGIIEHQELAEGADRASEKHKISTEDMNKVIKRQSQNKRESNADSQIIRYSNGGKSMNVQRPGPTGVSEKIYWQCEVEISSSMEYDNDRIILGLANGEVLFVNRELAKQFHQTNL